MKYVVAPNGIFSKLVPQYGNQLWDDTHFCPASKLTPEEAELFSVFPLVETPKPAYNPLTHGIAEGTPELDNGAWEQRWVVSALDPAVVEANLDHAEKARIASLWQAAHEYEFEQISGSAIGLLAMGVMMGKPKCLAVQAWIKSIWTIYYERGATASSDTDYSSCGQIPHSVPELMAELGV